MFKDRVLIWILEYIFGGALVLISLVDIVLRVSVQTDAYKWAAHLFVACLGVILISCSSSMRQRIFLARRLDVLTKKLEKLGISESLKKPPDS